MDRKPRPDLVEEQAWAAPVSSDGVVVITASAGGLEAITDVLSAVGNDFPLPIVLVQHRGDRDNDVLPELLARRTGLDVRPAKNGDLLEPRTVYVCPPGVHVTTERSLRLIRGPRLEFVRPSADLIFRSVARRYGPRGIAVVLSGRGSDGARGSVSIAEAGGTVFAQAPETSAWPEMPEAAVRHGRVAHVLSATEIGAALRALVTQGDGSAGEPEAAPIKVLLADDHRIFLDGLRTLLERERDMQIVGEAETGRVAVQLAQRFSADVVVMDLAMPVLSGIDAIRRLKVLAPKIKVVALSAHADEATIADVMHAGASGYLCKSVAFGELARAIRSLAASPGASAHS